MAGLVPAIHDFVLLNAFKTWMPATSAGMTNTKTEAFISGASYSAASRGGGRIDSTPSTEVAEIVVRTM